jgi:hypothetical protein
VYYIRGPIRDAPKIERIMSQVTENQGVSTSKSNLRAFITQSKTFWIKFDCGRIFYRNIHVTMYGPNGILQRDHEYNHDWNEYESMEKFVSAVWRKMSTGENVTELKIDGEYLVWNQNSFAPKG